jgi:hypothetical protein
MPLRPMGRWAARESGDRAGRCKSRSLDSLSSICRRNDWNFLMSVAALRQGALLTAQFRPLLMRPMPRQRNQRIAIQTANPRYPESKTVGALRLCTSVVCFIQRHAESSLVRSDVRWTCSCSKAPPVKEAVCRRRLRLAILDYSNRALSASAIWAPYKGSGHHGIRAMQLQTATTLGSEPVLARFDAYVVWLLLGLGHLWFALLGHDSRPHGILG